MKHALFGFLEGIPYEFLEGGDWTDDKLREVGELPLSDREKKLGGKDDKGRT